MPSYQPGIPTGLVPLNQDYKNIQDNFTTLDSTYLVDHVPLTTAPGPSIGFHKAIHLVPQAPPAVVPGFGELYVQTVNDGFSVGQQLWYQFQNTVPVTINFPLTRNIQPLGAATGYTFLPGGMFMQWGTGSTSTVGTNFPKSFPTAVFIMNVTPIGKTATSPIGVTSLNSSGYICENFTGQIGINFYWVAIGN